jgi:hypothetical protein
MSATAMSVSFDEISFTVHLDNGSALRVPLDWFPKLRAAMPEQRRDVRILRPARLCDGTNSTKTLVSAS